MNTINTDYLQHYGVKGMKWGVRRYQNADGTLTKEGKRQARKEYRADNKKAFELGRDGTIYDNAALKSLNRTITLENKLDRQYAKDPNGYKYRTNSLGRKWDASSKATKELVEKSKRLNQEAREHCDSLIKKYGKEAVVDIQYTQKKLKSGQYSPVSFKTMNESTTTIAEYAIAGAATAVSVSMMMFMNTPVAMILTPSSTRQKASNVEKLTYRRNLRG